MRVRGRLSYADIVSTICLCLVIGGGTAYAANTVFSTDIVDGQVKTVDLANGAVAVDKLADGSITGNKIKDDSIQGRDVLDNNLKGTDIDESTLSNIGGGGPAGGDLTGTYPDPEIAAGAVTGAEITDGSITGADVQDRSLTPSDLPDYQEIQVKQAQTDDTVGGGPADVTIVDSDGFPFELLARCEETSPGIVTARIFYRSTTLPVTSAVDSTAQGGVNDVTVAHGTLATLLSLGPTTGLHVATGTFTAMRVNDSNGEPFGRIFGTVSATTNLGNRDCLFKVSAFG